MLTGSPHTNQTVFGATFPCFFYLFCSAGCDPTWMVFMHRSKVRVEAIFRDDTEVRAAGPGENLRLKLSGVEESDISQGFVLSSVDNVVPSVKQFEARLMVLDLGKVWDYDSCGGFLSGRKIACLLSLMWSQGQTQGGVFTAGYKAVLHIHSIVEECEVSKLLAEVDLKTGGESKVGVQINATTY